MSSAAGPVADAARGASSTKLFIDLRSDGQSTSGELYMDRTRRQVQHGWGTLFEVVPGMYRRVHAAGGTTAAWDPTDIIK